MKYLGIGLFTLALAWGGFVTFLALRPVSADDLAEPIHTEHSLYNKISVVKVKNFGHCMLFNDGGASGLVQTCVDTDTPERLVLTYTQMIMAIAIMPNEAPRNILIVGLGGGALPMAFSRLFPDATVDVVDIDPAVLSMAKKYFGFMTSNRLRAHIRDARVFVRHALKDEHRYDMILLDAFNGEYIPEHLMTVEWLQDVKALLSDNGIVAYNSFMRHRLYHHESVTHQAVFGRFYSLHDAPSGTRIIFASRNALPSGDAMRQRAHVFKAKLEPMGVDIESLAKRFRQDVDWDASVAPLTDAWAPANVLKLAE